MKLVTFLNTNQESRIGWLLGDSVVDMRLASEKLPTDMLTFIDNHEEYFTIIKALGDVQPHYQLSDVKLLAPLPNPRSLEITSVLKCTCKMRLAVLGIPSGLRGTICQFSISPITKPFMAQTMKSSVQPKKRRWILS